MKFTVTGGKGVLTIKDDSTGDTSRELIGGKAVIADPGMFGISSGSSSGSLSGGNGGCFIATAAFGSYLHPFVRILRDFRDRILMTNRFGHSFVAWYYRASPPIAERIRTSETMKAGVRILLLPAVGFSYLCINLGLVPAFGMLLFLAVMCWVGARWLRMWG